MHGMTPNLRLPLRRRMPAARLTLIAWIATLAMPGLSGCTVRPPISSHEHRIDSTTLGVELVGTAQAAPFCLHLRHGNTFLGVYSENRIEAWVTDGSCAAAPPAGAARTVDAIRISGRWDWHDTQFSRQCMQTDRCLSHERNIVEGRHIRCASATARVGNQVAHIVSDEAACR